MVPFCLLSLLALSWSDPATDPADKVASEEARPVAGGAPPNGDDDDDDDESPAHVELPGMIVVGTVEQVGVPHVPLDAPGSRDVLGPEEVERIGARDLNDLIQYLPAVSTRPYNGGESSAPSFSTRGLPDDGLTEYILVLIDGVPANPMPYGWTAFSFFPLMTEQVHAIDLIRGGYSVRYSPNTVGGVLNLITPPIPAGETYGVRSIFGSYDYVSNAVSAGDTQGDFGWLVTLGERHGDGFRHGSDFEYRSADVRTRWTDGPDGWLALRASYIENEHRPPGGLTQAQFEEDRFANARPNNIFRGHRAVIDVVRHAETGDGFVEAFGWAAQTRRNLQRDNPVFGTPTDHRVVDDDAYTAALGLRARSTARWLGLDHDLYYGVRVSQELLPNRTTKQHPLSGGATTTLQDADYQLTAFSVHVDDTLALTERWDVVAGVRAEWIPIAEGEDDVTGGDFDDEFFALLPGFSSSYELTDELAVFANYQRSFRSPQVFGFDVSAANPDQEIGFEDGQTYEVGVRTELEAGLSGSIAAWHTDFEDVGIFDTNGVYQTIGDIAAEGVDVVVRWDLGPAIEALDGFSLYGSYTLQDSEIEDAVDPANDGNETPYAWEHKAAWTVQYETDDRWRLALGGVHVGESFSDDANTAEESANGNLGLNASRTIWDAQVSKEIVTGKALIRLSIGATNVFDKEWSVHSRGGFFGGGEVAGPPRQVYASLNVSL